jgi:hypothetical protein
VHYPQRLIRPFSPSPLCTHLSFAPEIWNNLSTYTDLRPVAQNVIDLELCVQKCLFVGGNCCSIFEGTLLHSLHAVA